MPPILACICYCWRKFIFIDYNEFWPVFARGGKTQNFGFMFGLGSLMIRVRFCLNSEYFNKNSFMFGSSSVNVGFWFGSVSSSMELEMRFHGGHLLQINCSCKYQLID